MRNFGVLFEKSSTLTTDIRQHEYKTTHIHLKQQELYFPLLFSNICICKINNVNRKHGHCHDTDIGKIIFKGGRPAAVQASIDTPAERSMESL